MILTTMNMMLETEITNEALLIYNYKLLFKNYIIFKSINNGARILRVQKIVFQRKTGIFITHSYFTGYGKEVFKILLQIVQAYYQTGRQRLTKS